MADLNGEKFWLRKAINILIPILLTLIAALWASTNEKARTACEKNAEQDIGITRLETNYENIEKLLKDIKTDLKDIKDQK